MTISLIRRDAFWVIPISIVETQLGQHIPLIRTMYDSEEAAIAAIKTAYNKAIKTDKVVSVEIDL